MLPFLQKLLSHKTDFQSYVRVTAVQLSADVRTKNRRKRHDILRRNKFFLRHCVGGLHATAARQQMMATTTGSSVMNVMNRHGTDNDFDMHWDSLNYPAWQSVLKRKFHYLLWMDLLQNKVQQIHNDASSRLLCWSQVRRRRRRQTCERRRSCEQHNKRYNASCVVQEIVSSNDL